MILTPLRVESEIRGVLLVGDRANAERFRTEHVRLVETYAGHAGVLIENDRLEESLSQVTELKDQLRHQAFHDALTGLPNRTLFAERVGRSLGDGEIRSTAVLFLDLDDFKTINDSLGHYVGDQLLIAVARRVETCIRPIDLPARLGGDEFAVLLRHAEIADAEHIADRLVRSIEQPFLIDKRDISIHASVGIALSGADVAGSEELLRNADVAMYDAKRAGKRGFVTYKPEMHTRVRERQELAFAIERAVERGEIGVHYQPIVDLESRTLVALRGPGPLEPSGPRRARTERFIPLADELGFMVEIGRTVLREACRQARSWELAYPDHEGLTVNVNLAPSELQNPELAREVAAMLDEMNLAPERLALEITESGVMRNPDVALQTMRELRELGVALGLDDFGTGHSSLAYLREFPLDSLKIARPFVTGLPDGELDAVFVEAIVHLATSLGLDVVAEGIESAAQCQAVAALGCTHAQGFYFGEPLAGIGVSSYLWAPTLPAGRPVARQRRVGPDRSGLYGGENGLRLRDAGDVLSGRVVQIRLDHDRRPAAGGTERDVATTCPSRTARKKFVFDSMVAVPVEPSGRLRKAHSAPAASASDISAPPWRTPPAVQSRSSQGRRASTSSADADMTSTPRSSASGIEARAVAVSSASGSIPPLHTLGLRSRDVGAELVDTESELSPDRAWWLRVPAVLLSPRSVFFALREDDPEDVAARSEPILLVVWLAGAATVLATPTAAELLDNPSYDPLLVAIWAFIAGGIYGAVGYFLLGFAIFFGARLLGSLGDFRRERQLVGFALVPLALSLLLVLPLRLALYGGDAFRGGGARRGNR